MTNTISKQEQQEEKEQRLAIINEALGDYGGLMEYIQQYVVNEFMGEGWWSSYYIINEEEVNITFNTYRHLGQSVVNEYIKSNKCGLSIKDVNEVLYAYKEIALDMDLDMGDNIGHMVNSIMFNIADTVSNHLEIKS